VNVLGVLPFETDLGNGKRTLNSGPINTNLRDRLEAALILVNPLNKDEQGRFTKDTKRLLLDPGTLISRKYPGVNPYKPSADRAKLFESAYPVAWQSAMPAKPHAFLKGVVSLSRDHKNLAVKITMFTATQPARDVTLAEFTVKTDHVILSDMGRGFALSRSNAVQKNITSIEALNNAITNQSSDADLGNQQNNQSPFNQNSEAKWVQLTVAYNGQPQPLQPNAADGNNNWLVGDVNTGLPEGQTMSFRLKNLSQERLGVVLIVNNHSTLYGEAPDQPEKMSMWILDSGKEITIEGQFERDNKTWRKLVGLSPDESKGRHEELGGNRFAGSIHMYVFREQRDAPVTTETALVAVGQSFRPGGTRYGQKTDPAAFAKHIAKNMGASLGKGLAAPTELGGMKDLQVVEFKNIMQVEYMQLRYYKPAGEIYDQYTDPN